MRTDYARDGFARSFNRSRPLNAETTERWIGELRDAVAPRTSLTRVVDLGAGTGRFWPVIRRAWSPEVIVALDNSPAMLEAAGTAPDVEVIVGELDGVEWKGQHPEAVFCSMALQYSDDPRALCGTVYEQLAANGIFALRTATAETISTNVVLRHFRTALEAEVRAFPPLSVIEGWMKQAGFEVRSRTVNTRPASGHGQLIARAIRRGLPALQLVRLPEMVGGIARLTAWSVREVVARRPVPWEETVLVIGRKG